MYEKILKDSGLKDKESQLYGILLEKGASPASEIIKSSKLKKGIVYKTLYDLEAKKLISQYTENKKLYFKPEHPFRLAELADAQLKASQNQHLTLETYLPQLVSAFKTTGNQPGVKIYEGIEGIKEVYNDTLKEKATISAILQTSEVEPKIYSWLTRHYAKKRTELGIWANVIVAQDSKSKDYIRKNEKEHRETRSVPKERFPIGIEVDIYGDKVAFINFKKGQDLIGIIIHNPLIANTMRALFSLSWEQAQDYSN